MDALERRLIELNEALIQLTVKGKEALPEAEKAGLAAQQEFNKLKGLPSNHSVLPNAGINISDDDTVIINNDNCSGVSGYSGYSGYSGEPGVSGISGYSGISGFSGYSGSTGESGISGFSGYSGYSGISGYSGSTGESGISGFSGYSGVSGYSGASGSCDCCDQKAILVSTSYNIQPDDFYVGVNSEGPTTQTLPAVDTVSDCIMKIIKISMGPPIGNKKVTVTTADGALIDGETEYIMQSPYESITVILQGGEWHLVSHFLP